MIGGPEPRHPFVLALTNDEPSFYLSMPLGSGKNHVSGLEARKCHLPVTHHTDVTTHLHLQESSRRPSRGGSSNPGIADMALGCLDGHSAAVCEGPPPDLHKESPGLSRIQYANMAPFASSDCLPDRIDPASLFWSRPTPQVPTKANPRLCFQSPPGLDCRLETGDYSLICLRPKNNRGAGQGAYQRATEVTLTCCKLAARVVVVVTKKYHVLGTMYFALI